MQFFIATKFAKIVIFAIQNKFIYRVLLFYVQDKRFYDEGDDVSIGKATKALTYTFNLFHVFDLALEGGIGKISD